MYAYEIRNAKLYVFTLFAFPIQHIMVYFVVCIIIVMSLYDVEMLNKHRLNLILFRISSMP